MDKYYVYRPMLDLIGFTEGTDKGNAYNETLAYGAYTGGDVNLVSMTLAELDALQTRMLKHPKNALNSSACGRYQIVRTTARNIRKDLPSRYPATRKFDKDCQDEMACYLLGQRGIDKYLAGRLSEDTLIDNLAKEWASLPTTAGKGHYGGQHAAVTTLKVRSALAEVKRRHAEGQPVEKVEVPVPVEKPIVPEKVEKEVRQKTNWLSGIFGGGFFGGGFAAWFAGIDKDVLILILIVAAIVIAGVLFAGEWIVRRVKSIRREIEA
ncbi:hypothetical protein QTA58_22525 [Neorhizobium sp. CSC1952]|uniref:hypothetical protein n=1 Tax=Neorhizobium sp. CSC1952 TaxID=2978974 RepID=UPI0025A64C39|nr:hypothetical protein [Rhizobium sp. CSC1952]WJR66930.1 hypothetical protein QTA58_22525 [Rhizobium sp. CSC1952]